MPAVLRTSKAWQDTLHRLELDGSDLVLPSRDQSRALGFLEYHQGHNPGPGLAGRDRNKHEDVIDRAGT